jgi:hypothetical protein
VKVFLGLVVALFVAWGVVAVPGLLVETELFQVVDFRLEGAAYLTLEEAVDALGVPQRASIWDDTEIWEVALEAHPLVLDARIGRRPPGTLLLKVKERVPVALVPSPALEPVDVTGNRLPIDPARHRLDLPVIRPWSGVPGSDLTPEQLRALAQEIQRLAEADPQFFDVLSDVARDERGDVVVRAGEPGVAFRYSPPLPVQRLKDGLLVLDDVLGRSEKTPRTIDLRYVDQVVVRY